MSNQEPRYSFPNTKEYHMKSPSNNINSNIRQQQKKQKIIIYTNKT